MLSAVSTLYYICASGTWHIYTCTLSERVHISERLRVRSLPMCTSSTQCIHVRIGISDLYWQWPLCFQVRLSSDVSETILHGHARDLRKISKKQRCKWKSDGYVARALTCSVFQLQSFCSSDGGAEQSLAFPKSNLSSIYNTHHVMMDAKKKISH